VKISITNWLLFGPGRLYGGPFVGRYLLYRLNDIDRSLLFCEGESTVAITEIDTETQVIRTRAAVHKLEAVYLHFSLSARTPLSELGKIPPIKISLSDGVANRYSLDGVIVSLDTCKLPSKQGLLLGNIKAPSLINEIEDTFYVVRTPGPLIHARHLATVENALDGVYFQCYKISMMNEYDREYYDIYSDREWNLSVLRLVHQWQPMYEGVLERAVKV
jgi:hypothetical protein